MGMREYLGFAAPVVPNSKGPGVATIDMNELMSKYDLQEVVLNDGEPFIVVSEREASTKLADATTVSLGEIGSSSPSPFTSQSRREYNSDLYGIKGLEQYDRMRKGDGAVRGTLRLIKTPVLAARWFVEPASLSKKDVKIAKFVEDCLWEYTSYSWSQTLTEALLMCDFGYYMFEKVWEERLIDGVPRLVLKKLAPRHPMDVAKWHFDYNGGPQAVEFFPPNSYALDDNIVIPIKKMLVFTFDMEAGNIEGISVLRSAYKHWFYKEQLYKIDAIQKERHGIGIPVIKLPMGFSADDKRIANELGRNLRTNERAHVVLPPNWDLMFAKLEGQVVDALKSVEHHNSMIRENVLGSFLDGNVNTKDEDQVMFLKATRFTAAIIADVFNNYLIPELVQYNFGKAELPKLKARRIGETVDQRTLSFAIRNLIGANVIKPDDALEEYVREEMDLPRADPSTARETATPQAGNSAVAGPPRQGPPTAKPAAANAGTDKSGGQ
jgi:hypothetical protein